MERVETGLYTFEGDWPGIFIRGDDAMYLAGLLEGLLARLGTDDLARIRLYPYVTLLRKARIARVEESE